MSSPCVAGAVAGLLSVSPGLTNDVARIILETSADDILDPYGDGSNYPGFDIYSGYGRLNYNNMITTAPQVLAIINTPENNTVISGSVEINGTADGNQFVNYILEYGSGSEPSGWTEIYLSSTPVTDGLLGDWNTSGLSGEYSLRLKVGDYNQSIKTLYISDSPTALAGISSFTEGDTIIASAITPVNGYAFCPDFSHYLLRYSGSPTPTEWDTIALSTTPVINEDELGIWNTGILEEGQYDLQLIVFSHVGEEASITLSLTIESPFTVDNGWVASLSDTIAEL